MPRAVCVDTSAFVAAANRAEGERHQRAASEFARLAAAQVPLFFSNYVLSETLTLLRRRAGLQVALHFLAGLASSPRLDARRASVREEKAALDVFRRYREVPLSHCDCVTVAMMKARRTHEIFTFDDDFRSLGLVVLPLPDST